MGRRLNNQKSVGCLVKERRISEKERKSLCVKEKRNLIRGEDDRRAREKGYTSLAKEGYASVDLGINWLAAGSKKTARKKKKTTTTERTKRMEVTTARRQKANSPRLTVVRGGGVKRQKARHE